MFSGRTPLAALAALALNVAASAEIHTVLVGPGFDFLPAEITIQLDDTVHWQWNGGFHNVESGIGGVHDGNFRSGDPTSDPTTTFDVTFDQAFLDAHPMPDNLYPYYCIAHVGVGMVGSVTVEVAETCLADVNDDTTVDIDDLFEVLAHWGENGGTYDVNGDGVVDIEDVFDVLGAWGACP
ncbi:MAG: hypothetical protein JSV91_03960 [Phycisphaerales bacterium]|nr:MAG: hypothetical protein JSV91_03960 [Phycisphaerales bacterium]